MLTPFTTTSPKGKELAQSKEVSLFWSGMAEVRNSAGIDNEAPSSMTHVAEDDETQSTERLIILASARVFGYRLGTAVAVATQYRSVGHIEIDIHFVCDLVAAGQVRVLHVPSRYQFADIFT
ncbi:hypothetical protein Tco_0001413 [Tanacetum coccineum]